MFLLTIHYENSMAGACTMVATCSDRKHCQEKAGDILHQIIGDIDIKAISSLIITNESETETAGSMIDDYSSAWNIQYDAEGFLLTTHNQENRYCARYDEIVEVGQVFTLS